MQKIIFIIDDNVTNRFKAEEVLKKQYRVIALSSAAQMFQALEKFRPDLILLDIDMPEMSGFDAITRLKASDLYAEIPVIFLTGLSDAVSEAHGIELGAVDFIMKPFSEPVLLNRIKNHLQIASNYEYAKKLRDALGNITKAPDISSGFLKDAANVISKEACIALNVHRIGIWSYLEERRVLKSITYYDIATGKYGIYSDYDITEFLKKYTPSKLERLLVMNNSIMCKQLCKSPNDTICSASICAALIAPVRVDGKLAGVVSVMQDYCEEFPGKREWTIEEQNFASSLADLAALAISGSERRMAIEAAEAANKSKSFFLAKMSHEIRTPMNAILGMAELAMREDIPAVAQEYIFTVKQAGQNLLTIINDILDFSKIEAGKMELSSEEYLLSSVINDVINIIKIKVYDSRVRLIVNVDCNLPNQLCGDAIKIRQIMLNLLSNAIKYTEKGYISLNVVGETVDEGTTSLMIKVTDSGKGIKQEDLKKLFDAFVQLDNHNTLSTEGTGLGLAITHNFVTAMDGKIDVSSEYGEGSTFSIYIPQRVREYQALATINDPDDKNVLIFERRQICKDSVTQTMDGFGVKYEIVASTTEFYNRLMDGGVTHVFLASVLYERVKNEFPDIESDAKFILISEFGETVAYRGVSVLTTPIFCIPVAHFLNGASGSYFRDIHVQTETKFIAPSAKILIVDDIKTNLTVTKGMLLPYGVQTDLCKSGSGAIEAVKTKRYDLVLMDHMMPGMDGIEATAQIRALSVYNDPYYQTLPIVALTANAVSGMKEMFLSSGFNDFISKPIDTGKLNSILERWIPKEKQKLPIDTNGRYTEEAEEIRRNIQIEELDAAKGIAMTGGTYKNYMKVLDVFYQEGLEKICEIKSSLEAENIPLFTTHIHALKNAGAIIGADKLSETAEALELAGMRKDLAYIDENSLKFLSSFETLLDNLSVILSEGGLEKQNNSMDIEGLKSYLDEFKIALIDIDTAAIRELTYTLENIKYDTKTDNALSEILQKKLVGEYDEAVLLIDRLLNDWC